MTTSRWITAIVTAACLAAVVSAQDKQPKKKPAATKKAAAPSMPRPGPEMKELRDGMVGKWTSEGTMESGPFGPGGPVTGTSTVRSGPGGFSVIMEERSKMGNQSFAGHGVIAWDAEAKAYKMVWVDSMTPGVVMETGQKEGDNLVFKGEMMMMGKKMSLKDVISDRTPTSYTLTSYMDDGSGEKKMMSLKATKEEMPPPPAKK
jgi:hypothetical protein